MNLIVASILLILLATTAGVDSDELVFDHALHVDLECLDCHGGVSSSTAAEDHNIPDMEVCETCHDTDSEDNCGQCHRNPDDPQAVQSPGRKLLFSHQGHFGRQTNCQTCHAEAKHGEQTTFEPDMPNMPRCFACHNDIEVSARCDMCHGSQITIVDIHPENWRSQHAQPALDDPDWCQQCHASQNTCLDCHRGDNLRGQIHELNYEFTHGLDAKSHRLDCASCHNHETFCNDCHEQRNLIPVLHSNLSWLSDHGRAARRDVENCIACHESDDPSCARAGCHLDSDGLRGTNPRFHAPSSSQLSNKGDWHDDDGSVCYTCHTNSRQTGEGFCGYCHR